MPEIEREINGTICLIYLFLNYADMNSYNVCSHSFVACRCFFVAIYLNQPFVIGLYFKKALSEKQNVLQVVYRVISQDMYGSCKAFISMAVANASYPLMVLLQHMIIYFFKQDSTSCIWKLDTFSKS